MPSRYAPFVGGVEILTQNLAEALTLDRHEVEIWTAGVGGRPVEVASIDGLAVRRFDFALPAANVRSLRECSWRSPQTMRALINARRTFRPDVVHVQCFGPNGAYAFALCLLTSAPLVVSLQGETVMDDYDVFARSTTLRMSLRALSGTHRQ